MNNFRETEKTGTEIQNTGMSFRHTEIDKFRCSEISY